jgi:hypothetical protein
MKTRNLLAVALITSPVGLLVVKLIEELTNTVVHWDLLLLAYVGFLGSALGWIIRDMRDVRH